MEISISSRVLVAVTGAVLALGSNFAFRSIQFIHPVRVDNEAWFSLYIVTGDPPLVVVYRRDHLCRSRGIGIKMNCEKIMGGEMERLKSSFRLKFRTVRGGARYDFCPVEGGPCKRISFQHGRTSKCACHAKYHFLQSAGEVQGHTFFVDFQGQ